MRILTWLCGLRAVALAFAASVAGTNTQGNVITIIDADDKKVLLNQPGMVTLVLVCSEDSQEACRKAGRTMDPVHGHANYRQRIIVDLRDSLGGFVEDFVKSRMREDMDEEAKHLKEVYAKNGSRRNPRSDLSATPDFEGELCAKLGFAETSENLRAILFGKDGKEIRRWEQVEDLNQLRQAVEQALGAAPPAAASAGK
jgi:hypothetical protein